MKMIFIAAILIMALVISGVSYAEKGSASDILRKGLLGAGAGAVGGAASGAKGKDVWKGALAGAGVNLVGGMLLDSMSGEKVASEKDVQRLDSRDAYGQGYQDGFNNGYKQGFTQGYKEGINENIQGK